MIVGICEEGGILTGNEGEERDRKLRGRERERGEREGVYKEKDLCLEAFATQKEKTGGKKKKNKIPYIAGAL